MPISALRGSVTGVLLGIGCSLMYSLGSLFVKKLNTDLKLHAILLTCLRMTFIFFFAAPQVAFHKAPYFGQSSDRLWLALRAASGITSTAMSYYAFSYLPLADAGVILMTTTPFTLIFARIFLKEKFHFSDIPIIGLTFCGVVCILRPAFIFENIVPAMVEEIDWETRLLGSGLALGAAICQSLTFVAFRRLRQVNYATVSFTYALLASPLLWIVVLATGIFKMPPTYSTRVMIIGIAATAVVAQMLGIIAAKFLPAGVSSLIGTSEMVFYFAWQVAFLNGTLNVFSIVGCLLIGVAISFMSLRTVVTEKYKDEPNKNAFLRFLFFIFR